MSFMISFFSKTYVPSMWFTYLKLPVYMFMLELINSLKQLKG